MWSLYCGAKAIILYTFLPLAPICNRLPENVKRMHGEFRLPDDFKGNGQDHEGSVKSIGNMQWQLAINTTESP